MSTERQLITEAYNQVAIWKTEAQYLKKRIEELEGKRFKQDEESPHDYVAIWRYEETLKRIK